MPMPNAQPITKSQPNVTDVHINRALTNVSIAYMQSHDIFLNEKYFPVVPVTKRSDKYFIYNKGDMLRIVAEERRSGTESAGSGYELGEGVYSCKTYALHKDVGYDERDNADSPLAPDRDATEYVTENLFMKRERDFLTSIFQASVWGSDATPTIKFDAADSNPIEFFKTQARILAKRIGKKRSQIKLIVTADVDDVVKEHLTVLDRVRYTSADSVSNEMIARLCEIKEYDVTEAVEAPNRKGSANENDIEYMVAPNQAFMCYVADRPSLKQPSAGYTFTWRAGQRTNAPRMRKIPMEWKQVDRIEGEMNYDHRIVSADCGIYLYDLLT